MTDIDQEEPRGRQLGGPLMTIEEVSKYLGIPVQTIYKWQKDGKDYGPPAIKVGKHLRWYPYVVRKWLDDRQRERQADRPDVARPPRHNGLSDGMGL